MRQRQTLQTEKKEVQMNYLKIMEEYRLAMKRASNDEHDIVSAMEEVQEVFRQKYSDSPELLEVFDNIDSGYERAYQSNPTLYLRVLESPDRVVKKIVLSDEIEKQVREVKNLSRFVRVSYENELGGSIVTLEENDPETEDTNGTFVIWEDKFYITNFFTKEMIYGVLESEGEYDTLGDKIDPKNNEKDWRYWENKLSEYWDITLTDTPDTVPNITLTKKLSFAIREVEGGDAISFYPVRLIQLAVSLIAEFENEDGRVNGFIAYHSGYDGFTLVDLINNKTYFGYIRKSDEGWD